MDSALAFLLDSPRAVPEDRVSFDPQSTLPRRELLGLLYRQVRSLAGPRHDLDDIVQAAALRVLEALPRFEGRSVWSTFTYGVVWRTLLDHDRWLARWRRRFVLSRDETNLEPPDAADGEQELIETRRARRLEVAPVGLPQEKRAVLVLHDVEGYSASEVARIVRTKEGTVRSRLRDARRFVAERLQNDPLFDEGAS
jgi:RNA polymerase sigma-70 factor (ECF subfamily)